MVASLIDSGESAIFCKKDVSVAGVTEATGVILPQSSISSAAATLTRKMGTCAIAADSSCTFTVCRSEKTITGADGHVLHENDLITIDSFTGNVYSNIVPTVSTREDPDYKEVLHWASKYKSMHILAVAANKLDVKTALLNGAEGVGQFRQVLHE